MDRQTEREREPPKLFTPGVRAGPYARCRREEGLHEANLADQAGSENSERH
eukprot:COSAG03_NODE_2232_length_2975_cov_32.085535_3_plen_51_part_00